MINLFFIDYYSQDNGELTTNTVCPTATVLSEQ